MENKKISGKLIFFFEIFNLVNFLCEEIIWKLWIFLTFSEKKRNNGSGNFDGTQKRNDLKKERHFEVSFGKRRPDAFSRLGVKEQADSCEAADDFPRPKISSRVISKEQPPATRETALAMQSKNHDLARNKRMFGSLLGTLQKFRNEEDKGVQEKRAKIEMKIEKQQLLVKEQIKHEKDTLIADRRRKQLEIKSLEVKMFKLRNLKAWEEHKQSLVHFIATKASPQIYFLPKTMTPKTDELLKESQQELQQLIEEKRREVNEEIKQIESRLEIDLQALDEGKLKKSQDGESEASDNNPFSDNENNEAIKELTKKDVDSTTNGSSISMKSWLNSFHLFHIHFQTVNVNEAFQPRKP